jgi:sigma-B regulation protein RsbU (phosphoserine phosphatase)
MCDVDSRTILSDINRLVGERGLAAMTTAAVVAYYAQEQKACVSYAGHPPALFKRRQDEQWSFAVPRPESRASGDPTDLPLAVVSGARYEQLAISVATGDRLFVYTDGVTEARSPDGTLFGAQRLKRALDSNENLSPSRLKKAVLEALRRHTGDGLTHDDVTLIAIEIR